MDTGLPRLTPLVLKTKAEARADTPVALGVGWIEDLENGQKPETVIRLT